MPAMPNCGTTWETRPHAPMPSGSTTSVSITATKYDVAAPSAPGGQWRATALFGQHDQLFGWSPTELLDELIEHRHRHHMHK